MTSSSDPDGLTPSEKYLTRLATRSFLSLWSYANVFQKPGKEMCDLLVIFGYQAVIFSVKDCEYPDTGDPKKDWERWRKKTIDASARQAYGAERWLRSHPDRIFVDSGGKERFPLDVPKGDDLVVHRVVVALGARDRCIEHYGGTGSLIHSPPDHSNGRPEPALPFSVGDVDPSKGWIHVLDDYTLDIVLGELDTVTDFTDYLSRRESFMRSGRLLSAAGEEHLLAHYLLGVNDDDEHHFAVPDGHSVVVLDESFWPSLEGHPQYVLRKEADRNSYLWDDLIEEFAGHLIAGTSIRDESLSIGEIERGLRVMAGEPRVARRVLADALIGLGKRSDETKDRPRLAHSPRRPSVGYVFLFEPPREGESDDEYRSRRSQKLRCYCYAAKHVVPGFVDIVGLGMTSPGVGWHSEDLVYLDCREWNEHDEALALDLHKKGLFKNAKTFAETVYEFPDVDLGTKARSKHGYRTRSKSERRKARRAGKRGKRG